MLSVARNILHQMRNVLGRMWREVVSFDLRNSPDVFLHGMRYTKRNLSQESKSLGQVWSSRILCKIATFLTAIFGQGM
jgi:hypothetical protein